MWWGVFFTAAHALGGVPPPIELTRSSSPPPEPGSVPLRPDRIRRDRIRPDRIWPNRIRPGRIWLDRIRRGRTALSGG